MTLVLSDVKHNFTTEAFDFETINDEIVLYFKDIKKALVLNTTCSMIWKMIEQAQENDSELNDDTMATHIIEHFQLPETMRKTVKKDIYDLFQNLITEKVIHMTAAEEENKGVCV